jgi:hypothetical protein
VRSSLVACSSSKDAHGTSYTIAAAETVKTPGSRFLPGCPEIIVWWSRSFERLSEETLIIRQEYPDRPTADVLELTFGQAYDLIDALNKAVEAS